MKNRGVHRFPSYPFLAPLGRLYLAAAALRNRAFDKGWSKTISASCPVLSIGNLSVGGTGKTPAVIWLVEVLEKKGLRTAVVSRGYRGRRNTDPLLVWKDGKALSDADSAGDEAMMIAKTGRASLVVVGRRRNEAADLATENGAEVIVLDDGFQHRRLARDLDILLLDARDPFESGRGFPAGTLRESASGIARAGLLILTRAEPSSMQGEGALSADEMPEELARLWSSLPSDSRPIVLAARHEPTCLIDPNGGEHGLAALAGRPVIAASGIARPLCFEETLDQLRMKVAKSFRWPDHHAFSEKDTSALERAVAAHPEAIIVTTSKDLVRWPRKAPRPWTLSIALSLRGQAHALAVIDETLRASRAESSCRSR